LRELEFVLLLLVAINLETIVYRGELVVYSYSYVIAVDCVEVSSFLHHFATYQLPLKREERACTISTTIRPKHEARGIIIRFATDGFPEPWNLELDNVSEGIF